jgi:acyl carrier protein
MSEQDGPIAPSQWPTMPGSVGIEEILCLISHKTKIARDALVPEATMESLDIASLDMVEILFEIEEKFDTYIALGDDLAGELHLGGFVKVLAGQLQGDAPPPGNPIR